MKVNFKQSWTHLMKLTEAHKPEVLTGIGVSMMIAAVPLAIAATIASYKKVEEKKTEIADEIKQANNDDESAVDMDSIEVPTKEIVKVSWKYYIPSVAAMGVGAFCAISSTKEGLKRTAAMAAAYQLTESALNEYKNKTREVIGDKKSDEIEQKIMKDRMELMTDDDGHIVNIYDTRDGATLCYDYWGGRYFYSDIDYIRSQINNVNQCMLKEAQAFEGYATLNDVYNAIGLPPAGSCEDLVWRLNVEGLIELKPYSILVDDKPCWVLNFVKAPSRVQPWEMNRL